MGRDAKLTNTAKAQPLGRPYEIALTPSAFRSIALPRHELVTDRDGVWVAVVERSDDVHRTFDVAADRRHELLGAFVRLGRKGAIGEEFSRFADRFGLLGIGPSTRHESFHRWRAEAELVSISLVYGKFANGRMRTVDLGRFLASASGKRPKWLARVKGDPQLRRELVHLRAEAAQDMAGRLTNRLWWRPDDDGYLRGVRLLAVAMGGASPRVKLSVVARDRMDWIWLQLADEIQRQNRITQCRYCGAVVIVRKTGQRFCSIEGATCRQAANVRSARRRKRPARNVRRPT